MSPLRQRLVALGLGLAASLVILGGQLAGGFEAVEAVVTDLQMRLRGPRPVDPRVAIVAVDAASIDLLGRWPWPRDCQAAIVDAIAAAGARVVALDLVLSEPTRSPPGIDLAFQDEALADALGRTEGAVLGYFFRREIPPEPILAPGLAPSCAAPRAEPSQLDLAAWSFQTVVGGPYPVPRRPAVEPNLDLFAERASAQGFFSHERQEGVQRRYELVNAYRGRYYPALALSAVARFLGADLSLRPYQGGLPEIRIGERRVQADERGQLWLSYRGPAGSFPTYSAAAVLAGEIPAQALADRLVFLGATETGIGDVAATPFGAEVPGVEVHATAADNLLGGRYLHDTAVQTGWSLLALLLVGPLVALLVSLIDRHLLGSLAAMALVVSWPVVCHLAFRMAGWHLQLVPPVLAGGLALVAALRFQVGTVEHRARFLRRAFQQYVSQAVVEEMLRDPEHSLALGGEERDMTVLFSDIRGFTTLSEGLDPRTVVRLLNEFFTPMTRLVLAEGGTLDKYMGDALMAFFGAPVAQGDHARRGCIAALAMRDELVQLNQHWRTAGRLGEDEAVGIGIGLNSGTMAVGNMGSDDVFDYTVIGDNVNLGSRIEGLNKRYGTEILCSAATVESVSRADGEGTPESSGEGFLFRELDRVRVKGKKEPTTLFELVAARPAPEAVEARVAAFDKGLKLYREARFAEAVATFAQLLDTFGADPPAAVFLARCRRLVADPPGPEWDGIETLSEK